MACVLVVEDEERYREVVCRCLALEGHDVHETADARRAIALGLLHRPDALVADWMLRNSVHGLHVAEALHVADPALHTVVVTGFPARDVTVDAERIGIADILEKPFDVETLARAVARAAETPAGAGGDEEVIGLVAADADGALVHRNRAGAARLDELPGGGSATRLDELFPASMLARADTAWVETPPALGGLWVRRRALDDGGCVLLLCPAAQAWRRQDPRVRMLLGGALGRAAEGVFRDGMLLVDDSEAVRDAFVAQLGHRGCPARAAGRHADAIDIFRTDPRIRVVILDWAMPGEDLRTTVARLREIRPEVQLVGTSGEDRSEGFAELGIHDFLQKPWTVAGELAGLLGEDLPSSNGDEGPSGVKP